MKILVTEAQLRLLMEDYYDPDKLYLRSYIIDRLDKAPKYIKKLGKSLDSIKKDDPKTGESKVYTKISQQLWQYLFGNF